MPALPEPAEEFFLRGDLHQDHAEVLLLRGGQRRFFKLERARRIHRHLHAIQIVVFDRFGHHRAVGVAGHPDEARDLLFAQFVKRLYRAVFGFDLLKVFVGGEAVQMEQINAVGLQPLQTLFDFTQRLVARSGRRRNLRRQPDLLRRVVISIPTRVSLKPLP